MGKLKPISLNKFIKKLKNFGFEGPFSGGRHLFMSKGNLNLVIPNYHSNQDIGVGLLSRILKQANIDINNWLD